MVEPSGQLTLSAENTNSEQQTAIKNKHRQVRARITHSIKQIKEYIEQNNQNTKRFDKEIEELRCHFANAREYHTQLYDFADESQIPAMY